MLFDLETQVPAFYHITTASVHDAMAMSEIPYESGAYYVFDRGYNAFSALHRINRLESFFVVRAKDNVQFKCLRWRRRLPPNVLTDAEIQFSGESSFRKYPEKLRMVKVKDVEQNRVFSFLTNSFSLRATEVANLYRNRWQVELFFKWLKQHLKIKKFWGNTENAVRIQVSVAIVAYCLVAIVHRELRLEKSTCELLQILSVSLTDKTPISELCRQRRDDNAEESMTPFLPGFLD